mgnify:CR=1 FL=1
MEPSWTMSGISALFLSVSEILFQASPQSRTSIWTGIPVSLVKSARMPVSVSVGDAPLGIIQIFRGCAFCAAIAPVSAKAKHKNAFLNIRSINAFSYCFIGKKSVIYIYKCKLLKKLEKREKKFDFKTS